MELIEEALRLRIRLANVVTHYGEKYPKRYNLDDVAEVAMKYRMAQALALNWRWVLVPAEEDNATRT